MSGHSKWHSIRHKKVANDLQRGKILSKHNKIIAVVGKNDPNPETNTALKNVIINAKADGVPKDNIDRMLKKMVGDSEKSAEFVENVYEGFGPSGVPIIVTALTDNPNRTFPNVRTAFTKNGGTMGSPGTVSFLFDHIGVVLVKTAGKTEDELLEIAIESGAENLEYDTEESEIIANFEALGSVRDILSVRVEVIKSELQYRIKNPVEISEADSTQLEKLVDALEEVDDVDEVFVGVEN